MRRRSLLGAASTSMLGLAGCLRATEYTVTGVRVGPSPAPVGLDVEVTEPDAVIEHPARLEFALTSRKDVPIQVRNRGIWPFGLLELGPSLGADRSGPETLLWTSRYEESQYVDVRSHRHYTRDSTPLVRTLDPGATVSETYELHGDELYEAGTKYVRGAFEPPILEYAMKESENWEAFLPEIEVAIDNKGLL